MLTRNIKTTTLVIVIVVALAGVGIYIKSKISNDDLPTTNSVNKIKSPTEMYNTAVSFNPPTGWKIQEIRQNEFGAVECTYNQGDIFVTVMLRSSQEMKSNPQGDSPFLSPTTISQKEGNISTKTTSSAGSYDAPVPSSDILYKQSSSDGTLKGAVFYYSGLGDNRRLAAVINISYGDYLAINSVASDTNETKVFFSELLKSFK